MKLCHSAQKSNKFYWEAKNTEIGREENPFVVVEDFFP
jgi:hypothetical protein